MAAKRSRKRRAPPRLILLPQEYLEVVALGNVLFPSFYQFENGFRVLLNSYLTTLYGNDWWDQKLQTALPDIHEYAKDQKTKLAAMPWIGSSARVAVLPVHLITLGQLEQIVKKYKAECIPELFPTLEFFVGHMDVIKRVRNMYAHMFPCITKADCTLAKREIRTLGTHINDRLRKYPPL